MSRFEDIDYSSLKDTFRGMVNGGDELCQRLALNGHRLLEHLLTYRSVEDVTACIAQRPLLAVFLIAVALSCSIPILIFVLFTCITVLLTFTGFLVIEGTLLTIGTVFLCGFILSILIVMLSITAVVGLAYFGFTEMLGSLQTGRENGSSYAFLPSAPLLREETGNIRSIDAAQVH